MKRMWLVLLLIALVLTISYYYRAYQINQSNKAEVERYNQYTGQWEKARLSSDIPDRTAVVKTDNTNGLNNQSVIKGYFDHYDEASQTLKMRAAIAFTQNSLFEPVELKLSLHQSIYCVSEHYIDPNTSKSYSLKNLRIPVKDGATLFVPGEKIINFADFIERSSQLTFLLIQLTTDFSPNQTNYVQKIIATGLCDSS